MPRINVSTDRDSSVELHFEDFGRGRPVVLVHGWPLSGRAWEAQVGQLVEAGYRVITYDRRGFGSSAQPWEGYDYDTLAADLDALLTHLDLRDATLVGFSMGGGEVVRYLHNYGSSRVHQAVLAAAVPPYLYKSADNPDGGLDDAAIAQFEDGVRGDRPAFLEGFVTGFFQAGENTDLVSAAQHRYHVHLAEAASPKGTLECINAFARTDFRDDLARIEVPTLIIHGTQDAIVPFEVSGKRAHQALPGSTLALIEGAPHGLNLTHAKEFNQHLIEFLAK
ncbi:alpha/beta fold hydrolase [Streptomyces sp. AP-93]|uniref:alpha/beta fold hydrolase n=1 Tax=Streptomyces sp. AP-93 TaxID=2929048 RepID=UPI001FAF31F0|nr:alpha/beta hydrolase [Streptomyces sp. AP-93]MCJ0872667.1 alpha/beta hydrolase [Streptomyces sp. AP-93]